MAYLHLILHIIVPLAVALIAFRAQWQRVFCIMLATMLVDADHLLANPIYDPQRCSIGFHPLHHYWAIAVYAAACFYKPSRLIGIGLLIHMLLDGIDCL